MLLNDLEQLWKTLWLFFKGIFSLWLSSNKNNSWIFISVNDCRESPILRSEFKCLNKIGSFGRSFQTVIHVNMCRRKHLCSLLYHLFYDLISSKLLVRMNQSCSNSLCCRLTIHDRDTKRFILQGEKSSWQDFGSRGWISWQFFNQIGSKNPKLIFTGKWTIFKVL